jgi:hypothetical protein
MSLRRWLRGMCRIDWNGPGIRGLAASPGFLPEALESRRLLSVAPTVEAVEVGASTWTASFAEYLNVQGLGAAAYRVPDGADQLKNLPWSSINQFTLKFSEHVNVQTHDLVVYGVSGRQFPVFNLAYDPVTFTATWMLWQPVANDKLLLHVRNRVTDADGNRLDGEWTNGADAFPSGDGTADGVFEFRLNVLPGDVDQSGGAVNATDLGEIRARQRMPSDPAYTHFHDVDGNAVINVLDLGVVRGRQLTQLPIGEAQAILPSMPSSDDWYGSVVNANNYIISPRYMANLSPKLALVTDLSGTNVATWARAVRTVQAAHPQALIGTYHSARDAQLPGAFTTYPPRAVPREGLTESQILMRHPTEPQVDIVDYAQPAARQYLVDHVVENVVQTGRPLAFLDNVSHNETGFPVPWATTMTLLRELSTNLHGAGKRVIVNAAWVPGFTDTQSVDQFLATDVDGVSLEMGFYKNVRNSTPRIQTAMQQYRRMLDAGLTVIFVPLATVTGGANTVENLEIEQRLHAAFGMMFRRPGDRLFVSADFWRPPPTWADWPQRLGPALGDATILTTATGQIVMTRRFTNGTLALNTTTKEVSYVASAMGVFAQAIRNEPLRRRTLDQEILEQSPTGP